MKKKGGLTANPIDITYINDKKTNQKQYERIQQQELEKFKQKIEQSGQNSKIGYTTMQQPKIQKPIKQSFYKNFYVYYHEYKNNLKDLEETDKNISNDLNILIKYFRDYNYYKKNLNYDKSINNISYSKFKNNIIKSRINDYFNLDNFFTKNIDFFYRKKEIKPKLLSSYESKSLKF